MGLCALILCRHNRHVLTSQADVFTGSHVDVAQHAADSAAHVGNRLTGIGHFGTVAAHRDTNAAGAHQARIFSAQTGEIRSGSAARCRW